MTQPKIEKDFEPDILARTWTTRVIEQIRLSLLTNQQSIELKQPFNVVYNINRWNDALNQALKISEHSESFERCAEIKKLQEQVSLKTKSK